MAAPAAPVLALVPVPPTPQAVVKNGFHTKTWGNACYLSPGFLGSYISIPIPPAHQAPTCPYFRSSHPLLAFAIIPRPQNDFVVLADRSHIFHFVDTVREQVPDHEADGDGAR